MSARLVGSVLMAAHAAIAVAVIHLGWSYRQSAVLIE